MRLSRWFDDDVDILCFMFFDHASSLCFSILIYLNKYSLVVFFLIIQRWLVLLMIPIRTLRCGKSRT